MIQPIGKCPCGLPKPFEDCCKPVLADSSAALSPEALMRSRYTAFVLGDEEHLLSTWAPETRPASLGLDEKQTKWIRLEVHQEKIDPGDYSRGEVHFTATFIEDNQLIKLTENSRFIKIVGSWYYLDGNPTLSTGKLARNSSCPCGSGKKYKRCCHTT